MDAYSIIIPVHNEVHYIPLLLVSLKTYIDKGHEVIIINDGSTDGSLDILKSDKSIKLLNIKKNRGKGYAIKKGLSCALNRKVIIYDGDMELNPSEISKLMILHDEKRKRCVLGYRFKELKPLKSNFDWGNFMFTSFFNITFNSNHRDILCCAKAFYKTDIERYKLNSNGFDIDTELICLLTMINKNKIVDVPLNYKRRNIEEGKKLKVSDGWIILLRIVKMTKFF